jgi:hypothetical protein
MMIFSSFSTYSQEIVFQKEYNHNERVQCQKVSSNSNLLAVGTTSRIDLIDLNTLESIFEADIGDVISVDITVDELRLQALTKENIIYEWDLNSKQLLRQIDYFKNNDSITDVKKATYYPVDNRLCVYAYYVNKDVKKTYLYLYNNDENVMETGYKALDLFDFTSDGNYFVDLGILSVITSSERFPNLAQDLKQSDIIESFKDYDPFDKPRAISMDISSNNKYALITSDHDDISIIDIINGNLLYTFQKYIGYNSISAIDDTGNYIIIRGAFDGELKLFDIINKSVIYESNAFVLSTIIDYIQVKSLLFTNAGFGIKIYSFNLDAITNIEIEEQNFTFSIYPSPSYETVNLQFESNISGNFNSKLLDLNGAVLREYPINFVRVGNNQFTFSTSNYPPGEYFLVTDGIINENFSIIIGGE